MVSPSSLEPKLCRFRPAPIWPLKDDIKGQHYENGVTVKGTMSVCSWSAQMDCHSDTLKLVQECTNVCFVIRIVLESDGTSSGTEYCAYTSVV